MMKLSTPPFVLLLIGYSSVIAHINFMSNSVMKDLNKSSRWHTFKKRHVVIANSTVHNINYWNDIAKKRLGSLYGPDRPKQSFIRVNNVNKIIESFVGNATYCVTKPQFVKSHEKFDLVDMEWNTSSYAVYYMDLMYICVATEHGKPVHFAGFES